MAATKLKDGINATSYLAVSPNPQNILVLRTKPRDLMIICSQMIDGRPDVQNYQPD